MSGEYGKLTQSRNGIERK